MAHPTARPRGLLPGPGLAFPLFILGSIATAVELLRSPPSRWGIASAVFGVSGALIVGPDATQNAIEGSDVIRFVGVLGFVVLLVVVVGLGLMRALGAQR